MPIPIEDVPQVSFAMHLLDRAPSQLPWVFRKYKAVLCEVTLRSDGRAHIRVVFHIHNTGSGDADLTTLKQGFASDMADLRSFLTRDGVLYTQSKGLFCDVKPPLVYLDGYVSKHQPPEG